MSTIYLPGLAGEITDYLNDQAPRPSLRMAAGGAIALLGAIASARWELPLIGLYPDEVLDCVEPQRPRRDFPKTQGVGQNVMLVAGSGCGKGGIIEGVEQLLGSMETAHPSTAAIRQRLLTLQHFNHLALAGMEPEPEDVAKVRGIIKPATFDRLLGGSAILLAESTPEAFDHLLPHCYEGSALYGECLMIQHRGGRKPRNRQPQFQSSASLLRRLALLADLAPSTKTSRRLSLKSPPRLPSGIGSSSTGTWTPIATTDRSDWKGNGRALHRESPASSQ